MAEVRVRFAPSPTGFLHVGGLRTALYNYLFAKKNNGKFILRIEDTDRSRYVDGAVENLLNTIKECGLEYDEGPDKSGDYGPYFQSERTDLYRKYADELLDKGTAYRCFCSPERLDELRNLQKLRKEPPGYDGRCRLLSQDQINEHLEKKTPCTVRLKVPEKETVKFYDDVRGWISYEPENIDDQVLLKSDNFPTYHLANVVDDHLMKITHVIRGEEWLPSTPKHVVLYQAFGWEAPKFSHLPLLLNPDRTKLSKRQGDVAVEDYLNKGFVLQALLNYVALLGWNLGEGSEQEIFTKEELIENFSLERVNKAGAVFDQEKLRWMNGMYVRAMDENTFFYFVKPFFEKAGIQIDETDENKKICYSVRDNIELAQDIISETDIYFKEFNFENSDAHDLAEHEDSKKVYTVIVEKIQKIETLDADTFKALMKETQKETGFKGKGLWMPYRVGITGRMHGPDISTITTIFGKEKIINRLKKHLAF